MRGMDTQEMGRSLQSAFAAIPDRRGTRGRRWYVPSTPSFRRRPPGHPRPPPLFARHPFPSRLRYALRGAQPLRYPRMGSLLGCRHHTRFGVHLPRTSAVSGLRRSFSTLDVAVFTTAIAQW